MAKTIKPSRFAGLASGIKAPFEKGFWQDAYKDTWQKWLMDGTADAVKAVPGIARKGYESTVDTAKGLKHLDGADWRLSVRDGLRQSGRSLWNAAAGTSAFGGGLAKGLGTAQLKAMRGVSTPLYRRMLGDAAAESNYNDYENAINSFRSKVDRATDVVANWNDVVQSDDAYQYEEPQYVNRALGVGQEAIFGSLMLGTGGAGKSALHPGSSFLRGPTVTGLANATGRQMVSGMGRIGRLLRPQAVAGPLATAVPKAAIGANKAKLAQAAIAAARGRTPAKAAQNAAKLLQKGGQITERAANGAILSQKSSVLQRSASALNIATDAKNAKVIQDALSKAAVVAKQTGGRTDHIAANLLIKSGQLPKDRAFARSVIGMFQNPQKATSMVKAVAAHNKQLAGKLSVQPGQALNWGGRLFGPGVRKSLRTGGRRFSVAGQYVPVADYLTGFTHTNPDDPESVAGFKNRFRTWAPRAAFLNVPGALDTFIARSPDVMEGRVDGVARALTNSAAGFAHPDTPLLAEGVRYVADTASNALGMQLDKVLPPAAREKIKETLRTSPGSAISTLLKHMPDIPQALRETADANPDMPVAQFFRNEVNAAQSDPLLRWSGLQPSASSAVKHLAKNVWGRVPDIPAAAANGIKSQIKRSWYQDGGNQRVARALAGDTAVKDLQSAEKVWDALGYANQEILKGRARDVLKPAPEDPNNPTKPKKPLTVGEVADVLKVYDTAKDVAQSPNVEEALVKVDEIKRTLMEGLWIRRKDGKRLSRISRRPRECWVRTGRWPGWVTG